MSATTPAATEIVVASAAPATPSGLPVIQPAMSTGASSALRTTVSACTTIVGLTMPVPRSPDPMTARANCSASPGTNQKRKAVPASTIASFAAKKRMYGSPSA